MTPPEQLLEAVRDSIEAGAEQGRQLVNAALAATGSSSRFRGVKPGRAAPAAGEEGGVGERPSIFWDPYREGSPFSMDREAFIAKHLARATSTADLVPDEDVERYVDCLLSEAVLSNVSLPPGVGRTLYIRVVRIVQRTIINVLSLAEGELLGKELRLLKQPSRRCRFNNSCSSSAPDAQVMKLLAKRAIGDHIIDGKLVSPYLQELGIPMGLVERLYEDIITLAVRLVFDVSLTFQIRCLGHNVTCQITPDEMLHKAPGWDVALEKGVFGIFDDAEKRRWASLFVDDLLKDASVQMPELPDSVQRSIYSRVALVMLNLAETAMNHLRIHVAGMAFRPCLLESGFSLQDVAWHCRE
mmetsp:Transcript_23568/g.74228  ORF Transcript_23568/g.74228 Transcript_23568/m.74228 type:complete len:356 (-) Transcript_23568:37-1104(-)